MRKEAHEQGFLSTNGEPREHKRVLGLAKQLRGEAAAWREIERLGFGGSRIMASSAVRKTAIRRSGFLARIEAAEERGVRVPLRYLLLPKARCTPSGLRAMTVRQACVGWLGWRGPVPTAKRAPGELKRANAHVPDCEWMTGKCSTIGQGKTGHRPLRCMEEWPTICSHSRL